MDWKRKLTSRKFWAAIASFAAMLIITTGQSQEVATKVTSLIMAGAAVVAYIVGEGLVDAANVSQIPETITVETNVKTEPPDTKDNTIDIDIGDNG